MDLLSNLKNRSFLVAAVLCFAVGVSAQDSTSVPQPTPQTAALETKQDKSQKTVNEAAKPENSSVQKIEDDETAQVVNYYVNYLKEYRLGPEDVISVEVFGQPNYSKAGITIPPTANIAYPLIPGGVWVGGKTTEQVAKDIAKKLDEYIIEPQVTVSLEKVGSARYAVMGDVPQPGVRLMTRKVTAMSALMEAGGTLPTGSMKKAVIYRNNNTGGYAQVAVNLDDVRKGKTNDVELQPGDQLFIPGNKMKTFNSVLDTVTKASSFRLLFGFPF